MEFGCRYIYVDQSRSQGDNQICSQPCSVKASESQNGLPQVSRDNRVSQESNVNHIWQQESSTNLEQETPPAIPDRKKKPTLHCKPVLPQDGRRFQKSKAHQDFPLACCTNLEQQKARPPIPDRKKKPPLFQKSGATKSDTVTYDYASEGPIPNLVPYGATKSDTVMYDYATSEVPTTNAGPCSATKSGKNVYDDAIYEDVPKLDLEPGENLQNDNIYMEFPPVTPRDLEQSVLHYKKEPVACPASDISQNHPGITMLPNDHYYLDVLPALSTELKMQKIPPQPPEHPITPTMALSMDRLPANCNILLLNIGKMVDNSDTQILGFPLLCCRCSAAFSELNHVEENKTWTCVFCATENPLTEVGRNESEGGGDQLYMRDSQFGNEYATTEDTMLIFCIDISGSMSVTTEVIEDQNFECNNLKVYKSRMEAMKSGLSQTLEYLHKKHPRKRVALVTFSDQVKIYGDGTIQPQVLEDSELLDPDYLKSQGENQPVPQTLEETLHVLEAKIDCLKERGVTALGPAALVSIAMAAKRPGSKVIICTDGKANTDLGNLENIAEEYTYQSSKLYYNNLAELALQHSVVVSVVTIEGTDCRLPELGQLADKTGGKVNIVHPLNLACEFQSILEEEINATDVKVKVYLPHSMHFLYEGHTEPILERTFGSTNLDTVLSTEFDIHSDKIKEVLRYSQLPIQVQLTFTLPDGRGRYRILSQKRPVTNDSSAALDFINLSVLQNHSVQFSARLAMEGHVNEARKVALELKELVDQVMRHEKYEDQGEVYEDWECAMAPVYEDLQVYAQERSSKREDEDSHTEVPVVKSFSDEMAKMIFHMKRAKNRVLNKLKHQAE
ncbi:circularly permutated Ras protein 1-like [Mixophyes fleayi]|uniref:circularly permutated Ras protein 1-like n=1 Tax=Mixophyes fleayi TaxID=3061075 RepID=UPI003F4DECAC